MMRARRAVPFAMLASALSALSACIEVGHEAEIGCFVDRFEPGCPGGSLRDASADASEGGVTDARVTDVDVRDALASDASDASDRQNADEAP